MRASTAVPVAIALAGASSPADVVFATDFESGVPAEFSGVTSIEGVQGYAAHGFAGSFLRNLSSRPAEKTVLTLTDLPAHDFIHLGFLLAIIDTWDGPVDEASGGPDLFNVTVDGELVFSNHFQNAYGGAENYSAPAGVLLVEQTQLGFRNQSSNDKESGFSMGNDPAFQRIPHTASSVVIEWFASGAGWDHTGVGGAADESWAIDDVFVAVSSDGDPPSIRLTNVDATRFELSWTGVLQQSVGLDEWQDVSPQPICPWRVTPSAAAMFFRARDY